MMLHRGILEALRPGVVVHAEDGEERLVAQGRDVLEVGLRVAPVPHANELAPHGGAEDALTAGHEEPHHGHLCPRPGLTIDAIHVASKGGPLLHHLFPHVIQRLQQDGGNVKGHAAVARQQGVHEGVALRQGIQLPPMDRNLYQADELLGFVGMEYPVVKVALVLPDALGAELEVRGQGALLGGVAVIRVVVVRPDGPLSDLAVHHWVRVRSPARDLMEGVAGLVVKRLQLLVDLLAEPPVPLLQGLVPELERLHVVPHPEVAGRKGCHHVDGSPAYKGKSLQHEQVECPAALGIWRSGALLAGVDDAVALARAQQGTGLRRLLQRH
mmetsp:Transcript_41559/g.93767  ORF Transcript_41559/g.93767 Transcript_41559/m.93767 type:complete len:327 (+) Transcript_41559:634-1614(+)